MAPVDPEHIERKIEEAQELGRKRLAWDMAAHEIVECNEVLGRIIGGEKAAYVDTAERNEKKEFLATARDCTEYYDIPPLPPAYRLAFLEFVYGARVVVLPETKSTWTSVVQWCSGALAWLRLFFGGKK